MKRTKKSSALFLLVIIVVVFIAFATIPLEARKHNNKAKCKHPEERSSCHKAPIPGLAPSPLPHYGSYPNRSNVFDIMSFGARGNGVSDDSQALLAAWEAACSVPGSRVEIPAESKFLIHPVTLQGPCTSYLVLQIDGTLLAPPEVDEWPTSSLLQWLNFKWLHNFTIQGIGKVDGQGFDWWGPSNAYYLQKRSKHIPDTKPTALRFYASNNVTVRDIKIVNSPLCHLKFDDSSGVKVDNITISSPEASPNTDGIHLQNTRDVEIKYSNIGCGDDCVSIQTGCSNIHVHHINCGPGHGISLGGLGKDKTVACVSNIVVEEVSFQNSLAGVRMKTWQGGLGSVKNVSFSNIQVSDVKYPIIIDQYYCDKKLCKNQTGAVAISDVKYQTIIGTYTVQPLRLACSNDVPCTDVDLIDIQLKPSSLTRYRGLNQAALCWNSYGKAEAPIVPDSIDYCLRMESGSLRRASRSRERTCWL